MNRTIKDISENGPFKYFEHHIKYLKILNKWASFKAISDVPTLNDAILKIKKGERSFYYKANNLTTPKHVAPVAFQNIGYGFKKPFNLVNEKFEFYVPEGVNIHNIAFSGKIDHFGNINNLNTKNFSVGEKYYRAIIPIKYEEHNDITIFFKTESLKVDDWSKPIGLLILDKYDIFEYSFEGINYIVIDATKTISFEKFYDQLFKIIYCFAFISGNLYRDELNLFSSTDKTFREIDGFAFKEVAPSIIENLTVIPYRFIRSIKRLKDFDETRITSYSFNMIVNKTISEPELLRCIKLLTEAANLSLELRTSIYSVCLETIRNIIQEKNQEKLFPFKNKPDCRSFIDASKEILAGIPDASFNNRDAVKKRIENINQLGNTESFTSVFKLLGIELNKDDIECINRRNDFLHGRIPFEDIDELRYVADKLFQLVEYLILKYCEYSGVVLNQANLTLAMKNMPLEKDKFLLRKI